MRFIITRITSLHRPACISGILRFLSKPVQKCKCSAGMFVWVYSLIFASCCSLDCTHRRPILPRSALVEPPMTHELLFSWGAQLKWLDDHTLAPIWALFLGSGMATAFDCSRLPHSVFSSKGYCVECIKQQSLLECMIKASLAAMQGAGPRESSSIGIVSISKPDLSRLASTRSCIIFHPLSDSFPAMGQEWTWVHDMAAFICDCEGRRFWIHEH